jgi:cold shock CspA family protein
MTVIKGTVVRLLIEKGFGFIRPIDGESEYFFHRSAVTGTAFEQLREGQPA